jgi:hypothetical protein
LLTGAGAARFATGLGTGGASSASAGATIRRRARQPPKATCPCLAPRRWQVPASWSHRQARHAKQERRRLGRFSGSVAGRTLPLRQKSLKPVRRQRRVDRRAGDRPMTEPAARSAASWIACGRRSGARTHIPALPAVDEISGPPNLMSSTPAASPAPAQSAAWSARRRSPAPVVAGRLLELFALLDRDDERSGPADHAVFVVKIKVRNGGTGGVAPAQHDWQPVDGDARRQHLIPHDGDRRPHIIGAVTRNVDNAAQAAIAARVEQRLGKLQSPENRGPRRAPIGGALDLIGNRFGGFRAIDQPPCQNDSLVILAGPLKIRMAMRPWLPLRSAWRNSREVNPRM